MKKCIKTVLLNALCISSACNYAEAQAWNITGNAGTTPANFLGTTDNNPLRLRVNNIPSGIIEAPPNGLNVGIGANSLLNNTSNGWLNAALGYNSLTSNTDGTANVAIGAYSLEKNLKAQNNTAVGYVSLGLNTDGWNNTAVGSNSLRANKTGMNNTAVGMYSLFKNTEGSDNVAMGYSPLYSNDAGNYNIAIGTEAFYSHTTGDRNIAIGYKALRRSVVANEESSPNLAIGAEALADNTLGSTNTAVGHYSLWSNTTGIWNTAFGGGGLVTVTTGSYNVGVGINSLQFLTTGSQNTGLGTATQVTTGNISYSTAIGHNTIVDQSYKVRVGNTLITSIGGQVGWTTFSDARFKKNIQENVPGLEFITRLKPVTYNVGVEDINKHYADVISKNISPDKNGGIEMMDILNPGNANASQIVYTGFLAQEVEKVAKEIGYDFSGVDKPTNEDALYGLRYSEFVPPLVKAVQEQQAMIDQLKKEKEELFQRLDRLERLINSQNLERQSLDDKSGGIGLGQNIPNPFSSTTQINYSIEESGNILLQLFDNKGNHIKTLEKAFKERGDYNYILDGTNLQPGVYFYSLYLNGKELVKKAVKI